MIYIIAAAPREGKSYLLTKILREALEEQYKLKKAGKPYKKIFSNFPVICEFGSTLVWKPEYTKEEIIDSIIGIDEAWQYFNSRNYKGFTKDDHAFFALNGQNNNEIYLIAHSPNRMDTVIREMVNIFYFVKKVKIPFTNYPLWFRVESFLDELSISQRYSNPNAVYGVFHLFFRKKIARAYDTHFFKRNPVDQIEYAAWTDETDKWFIPEEYRKRIEENKTNISEAKDKILLKYGEIRKLLEPKARKLWERSKPAREYAEKKLNPYVNKFLEKHATIKKYTDKFNEKSTEEKKSFIKLTIAFFISSWIFGHI